MDLLDAMNQLAKSKDQILVCWQEQNSEVHKHQAFNTNHEAEKFFWNLGKATDFNYKFYAY